MRGAVGGDRRRQKVRGVLLSFFDNNCCSSFEDYLWKKNPDGQTDGNGISVLSVLK